MPAFFQNLIGALLAILSVLIATQADADIYHYRNVLIGERAAGMGGAFIAISDDPSGIIHNPAGIVYAVENYFSLSANAYNNTEIRYKDISPGQDYVYKSSGLIPTFFGFIQGSGKSKWGFAIAVPDADQIDQNDAISNFATGSGTTNTFYRRVQRNDSTYLVGPAYATEISKNFTIGLSLLGFYRSEKLIDNLLALNNPLGTGTYTLLNRTWNKTAYGVMPKLGAQFMPTPKIALGGTISQKIIAGGTGSSKTISKASTATNNNQSDVTITESTVTYDVPTPINLGAGIAFFASKKFLLSADLEYSLGQSTYADYEVQPVFNFSGGIEYYLSEETVTRLGLMSNFANTPQVSSSKTNQPENVNLYGAAASVSLLKPGSSLTIGGSLSLGSGKGQVLGNSTAVQEVTQQSLTAFIMGSYQM